ncbi:MAG: HAMP domain-containing protein [Elusimicrobiales bacterium]
MENQSKQQFQRKTIIVKKNLQYRYMFIISFTSLVAFMLVALDIVWSIYKVVEKHPGMLPLLDEIFSNAPLMFFKLAIYIMVVIIAGAIISHRIAGPIYKLEKICNAVANGDMTQRFFLRKGDALFELQNSFNTMMDNINSVMKMNEELKRKLSENPTAVDEIEKTNKKIEKIMPDFKV